MAGGVGRNLSRQWITSLHFFCAIKQASSRKPFLDPKSKRPDRQALSKSTSTAELNRVVDGEHYSKQARTQRCLIDKSNAQSHIQKLLPVQGSLFLIRLGHQEGELAVGLGRRLFDEASDDDVSKLVGALFLFTHLAH